MRAASGRFEQPPRADVEDLRILNESRGMTRVEFVKGVLALATAFVAADRRSAQEIRDLTYRLEQAVRQ